MNKKTGFKLLSLLLVLSLLFSMPFAASANTGDEIVPDGSITRVNVTIYGDSKTSRGFSWATKKNSGSDVMLYAIDAEGNPISEVKYYSGKSNSFMGYIYHKVVAADLEPGTMYAYRVGDKAAGKWSDLGTFKTDDGDDKFSFIAIADVQASSEKNFQFASKVLEAGYRTLPEAEFFMSAGDFVNDCTNEEWEWLFKSFKNIFMNTTAVPIAGNHDGNLKWHWFENQFNLKKGAGCDGITGVYYSFDYGNAHITVLNSNDMYPMSEQQVNWLQNDINKSDAKWKILVMHRPFYSAGKNVNKPDTMIMRDRLLPIIEKLNIDLIIAGHDHMYYRSKSVKNGKVVPTETITEVYKGVETVFEVNPAGVTHILPNTAGTKRYSVNQKAVSPILDIAAVASQPGLSMFSTFEIDGDRLVYKAYTVDVDNGGTVELYDQYAILKTVPGSAVEGWEDLDTNPSNNLFKNIANFFKHFTQVIFSYLKMLASR